MYLCIYVHVCVYVHVCMFVHVCMYVCTCTCMFVYTCTCMYMFVYICTCLYCMCVNTHTYKLYVIVHILYRSISVLFRLVIRRRLGSRGREIFTTSKGYGESQSVRLLLCFCFSKSYKVRIILFIGRGCEESRAIYICHGNHFDWWTPSFGKWNRNSVMLDFRIKSITFRMINKPFLCGTI